MIPHIPQAAPKLKIGKILLTKENAINWILAAALLWFVLTVLSDYGRADIAAAIALTIAVSVFLVYGVQTIQAVRGIHYQGAT